MRSETVPVEVGSGWDPATRAPLARARVVFEPRRRGGVVPRRSVSLLGAGTGAGCLLWLSSVMQRSGQGAWTPLWVLSALLLLSVPLLGRAMRREPDAHVRRLLVISLLLKMAASGLSYLVQFDVYGGQSDAVDYDAVGRTLGVRFRRGHLSLAPISHLAGGPGTQLVRVVTGVIYALVGPNMLAGFLVFSWASFWGLYLFHRAFRTAMPTGDARRYAYFLLLWPSVLFWSSGIGKDAWMFLMIGLAAWGMAQAFANRKAGLVALAIGLVGTALERPHISLMFVTALAGAYLLRRRPRRTRLGPVSKLLGLGMIAGLGAFAVMSFVSSFGLHGLSLSSAQRVMAEARTESEPGHSAISGGTTPFGMATLLFRPFPQEARDVTAMAASLEGMFLFATFVVSRRRLLTALRLLRRNGYVIFCVLYSAMFIIAFSVISNFGVLVRQRIQVTPFVLALLCLPPKPKPSLQRRAGDRRPVGSFPGRAPSGAATWRATISASRPGSSA